MHMVTFSTWRDETTFIRLDEIIAAIPENDWIWAISEFYVFGAEGPLTMFELGCPEFERLAFNRPYGFLMAWEELKTFAPMTGQIIDCIIIGAQSMGDLRQVKQSGIMGDWDARDDFTACEVFLQVVDGGEWWVSARDEATLRRLGEVF